MTRHGLCLIALAGFIQAAPLLAQDLSQPYVDGQVLVRFAPAAAAANRAVVRNALLATGSRELRLVPELELIRTPLDVPQAIAVLANNPNVEYIEPDYIVQPGAALPNDYYFGLEWGLNNTGQSIRGIYGIDDADIDMPEAWEASSESASTVVAVIDTGTQLDHPDLAANIWVNPGETPDNGQDDDGNGFIDDVHGWDFYNDDNDPSDESGHGTHTAGTIAAVTNNGIGVAGICRACKIMPLRFLGPSGGSTSDAILALDYAVENGATVSNNSWGGGGFSSSLYLAIQQAGTAGHIFSASAGNSALDTDANPHYPSSYDLPNVISVAATTNLDELASFSNYGQSSVDIGAPGLDIASLYMGSQYYWMSGTSMATPHVTAIVGLLQASFSGLSAQEIVGRVLDTARPAAALAGITATGGVLNAAAALAGAEPDPVDPVEVPATPGNFSATDGTNGTAILSWDPVAGATQYLVERQEIKAKGKNAGTWTGSTTFSVPGPASYTDSTGAKDLRYRIAAQNSAGTSTMTAWATVTVTDADGGGSGGPPHKCHPQKGC